MFETAELGQKLSKEQYEAREGTLRTELLDAQAELKDSKIPVIIVIGGVDGAGKGETVNLLHEWMDPHFLETHAVEVERLTARLPDTVHASHLRRAVGRVW